MRYISDSKSSFEFGLPTSSCMMYHFVALPKLLTVSDLNQTHWSGKAVVVLKIQIIQPNEWCSMVELLLIIDVYKPVAFIHLRRDNLLIFLNFIIRTDDVHPSFSDWCASWDQFYTRRPHGFRATANRSLQKSYAETPNHLRLFDHTATYPHIVLTLFLFNGYVVNITYRERNLRPPKLR